MQKNALYLEILGARGSVPVSGKDFSIFGGATSCARVLAGGEEIYLDAGSGIVSALPLPASRLSILLSHFHLDHLQGLPFFKALSMQGREIRIFGAARSGKSLDKALEQLFTPPYWPLSLGAYPARLRLCLLSEDAAVRRAILPDLSPSVCALAGASPPAHALPGGGEGRVQHVGRVFQLGDVQVSVLEGAHPGGASIYRLEYRGKSIVYASDFEPSGEKEMQLAAFARGCSVLLYDGQYTEEEYPAHRGYGHSVPSAGIRIAKMAGAGRLLFIHHAPQHGDAFLLEMEKKARAQFANASFAREGERICLS